MRTFVSVVTMVVFSLVAGLVNVVNAGESFPKMTLKVGHVNATDISYHKGLEKFAQIVKDRTAGAVTVQIFPNSQLGNEKDLVEQVKSGVIQMSVPGGGMLALFPGWEPLGVFGMPYILKGDTEPDQYKTLRDLSRGPIMKEIATRAAATSGIRTLDMAWWYGVRHLTTKAKQVKALADLQGLKIRTPDNPVNKLAMTALGASVTPMAVGELYTALQLGVVEGQENPFNTIFVQKFFEVQKYLTLTAHMSQHQVLIINDRLFQQMPAALKAIVESAAFEAGDFQSDLQLKANAQGLEDLKAKGMTVNTVDLKEFAAKTKDAWKEFEPKFGKGLYEQIQAAQR